MNKAGILAVIAEQIRTVVPELPDKPIDPAQSMRDMGINSIERADIILGAMERLGLNLPLTDMSSAGNIGDLVALFHDRQRN